MTAAGILVNGIHEAIREKVGVSMCGRTVRFMKGSGRTTCLTATDDSSTVMATCIKVNGELTQRMVEAWKPAWMAHIMKVTGKPIKCMVEEYSCGRMVADMRESTRTI